MTFNKEKANEHKEWLTNFLPGTYLVNRIATIPIDGFINKDLIPLLMADNARPTPSMVDGLDSGQRKVIFGAFKMMLTADIRVDQFAGYVTANSAYHHGDQRLASTIIGLAQDFVGSNNINFLLPNGQFGSRVQGGKDAASPRYIYTALSPIARRIFHVHDDPLLTYLTDDDTKIEPEWYMPIIPMVLVNGSDGIGTGWSSNIPNYNPVDIIANIRRLMKGEEQVPMLPWYRGFTGPVVKESEHRYKTSGVIEELDESTVRITELPIRTWTTPYKEQIETWITGTEKVPSWIKDFRDDSNQARVDLTVTLTQEQLRKAREEGLESKFKLASTVSTSNMVCFDPQGRIKRYSSAEEIVQDFFDLRLDYYRKRKEHLTNLFAKQWMRLDNKVQFLLMVLSGDLQLNNHQVFIIQNLRDNGFEPESELDPNNNPLADQDGEGPKARVDNEHDYDYLLDMPLRRLLHEEVEELKEQRDAKGVELDVFDKTEVDLWNEDLDDFTAAWEQWLRI
ncbi:MAG: DNA topoisomerase II [Benniella sp.]|nr:MAG: DNA topoisomerase II [Benniella sp.]